MTRTIVALLMLRAASSFADDALVRERRGLNTRTLEAPRASPEWKQYLAECSSCHLAFPPNLLPASSWQRLISTSPEHFGQNVTLDASTSARLSAFLTKFAGPPATNASLRITSSVWWVRAHDELAASVYLRPAILSAANCPACHRAAEQGRFGEAEVIIPREKPTAP